MLALLVLASGCGSKKKPALVRTDKSAKAPPTNTFALAVADNKLRFDKTTLKASAGTVQLVLTNPSSARHNIAIKGNGVNIKGRVVGKGGRSSIQVTLKPGTYEFYCSVDGHEQAGMKGVLRVGNKT
jgi:uncharacterized cupredoxin-like copper-binding protein